MPLFWGGFPVRGWKPAAWGASGRPGRGGPAAFTLPRGPQRAPQLCPPTVVAASLRQGDPDLGLLGPSSSWICSASQGSGATPPRAWAPSRGSPSALSGLGVGRARPLRPHQPGRAGGSPGPRMSDVIGCPINEQVVAPTCSHSSPRRLGLDGARPQRARGP